MKLQQEVAGIGIRAAVQDRRMKDASFGKGAMHRTQRVGHQAGKHQEDLVTIQPFFTLIVLDYWCPWTPSRRFRR